MKKVRVYIVLEHHKGNKDCKIHGVYCRREGAEKRAERIKERADARKLGYISIIEKAIIDDGQLGVSLISPLSGDVLACLKLKNLP